MVALTQRLIDKLPPKAKPYEVLDDAPKGFLVRVQPSGRKSYYFAYRPIGGKRQRVFLGAITSISLTAAKKQAYQMSAQVVMGENPRQLQKQAEKKAKAARLSTLGAFMENEYIPWFIEHRKSGVKATNELKRGFAFLANTPMNEIDPLMIERWRTQKHQQGVTKSTLNRSLTAIRCCLNKAVEWGYLDKNPILYVRPYKLDRNKCVVRYLSAEEEMNLRKALDDREGVLREERDSSNQWRAERGYDLYPDLKQCAFADYLKPLILVAMNTGLRKGELLTLSWHNISFDHKLLTVSGENAKSGQTRHVPLNNEAITVLQRWKPQSTSSYWVFPSHTGEPLTDVKKSWAKVLQMANIQKFRFHDLRHHFASRLVMAGVDLNTIRELLGHADYSSTLRYAHLAPSALTEAVAKLTPRQWGDCKNIATLESSMGS